MKETSGVVYGVTANTPGFRIFNPSDPSLRIVEAEHDMKENTVSFARVSDLCVCVRKMTTLVHVAANNAELTAFTQLDAIERQYVTGLKRKDRTDIVRLINEPKHWRPEAPLRVQVLQSNIPRHVRLQIFEVLGQTQCEKYKNWVRRLIRLPLNLLYPMKTAKTDMAIKQAKLKMDEMITGYEDAKREVLKLVCQAGTTGGVCESNYSLGFEGPPGTGKTHFVKTALKAALGRPLISIPLGGANDVAYLFGHLYVYEGSKEGRLASSLIEAGCCNPIIYFDEVDKVSTTDRGSEIINALIHLIDPTANKTLRDRYFHGVDIDYSKCTFVFSYNDPSRVSPILLDRIKRIPMPIPTDTERKHIVCNHLVPRVQKKLKTNLALSDEAVQVILARACAAKGGMRIAEKDVDHAIANAVLCHTCNETHGALAGVKDTKVLDDKGAVSGSFTSQVLPKIDGEHDTPPEGMYN